jgi:eukaryotic-like serine/threonine-protein kinase
VSAAEHVEPLGRYRLESPLNGLSQLVSVWSATDELLQRPVTVAAISIGAPSGEDGAAVRAQVVQRLRRAAQLTSSATVAIYDIVESSDVVYVVGESIDAPTLRERVRESGLLSTDEACDLAKHLLHAISEAHQREVIHGCINPSNVFVFADGSVKLAGFGWLQDDDSASAKHGPYVAPEVVAGDLVGPAADLWGLGAVLHFARHGTPPGAARIVDSVSNASPELEALAAALLHDDPEQRPEATEAVSALGSLRRPRRPALASPPDTTEIPAVAAAIRPAESRGATRRAWITIASIAIAVIALGAAAVTLRGGESSTSRDSPPPTATADRSTTSTATQVSPAASVPQVIAASTSVGNPAGSTQSTGSTPALPGGWTLYTDRATGYRIAKPEHWTIRPVTAYRTDFVDPASSTFIRVEWTDKPGPDPVEAWRNQARTFAAQQQGYEELRIAPAVFKGHPSAEWEFRYLDRGVLRHALDLGMVTGRYGAALFAVAPETNWPQLQTLLNTFRATFEPPT